MITQKILCVEDAADAVLILKSVLRDYSLEFATTAQEAKEFIVKNHYDLVLMDISLNDGDGLDIVSKCAKHLENTPVIFLTGKRDIESKSQAFSLGAEDFVVKPFDPDELLLRIGARLKRAKSNLTKQTSITVGPLTCHVQDQKAVVRDRTIDLTSIEFRILLFLAQNPNHVFSRTEIIQKVWGAGITVSDRSVDVHISNLRKKLGSADIAIEALVGTGYRLKSAA